MLCELFFIVSVGLMYIKYISDEETYCGTSIQLGRGVTQMPAVITLPTILSKTFQYYLLIAVMLLANISLAVEPSDITSEGTERLTENQLAQENIDEVYEQKEKLEDQYYSVLKVVEGLEVYNALLARQIDNQNSEISKLENSIANTAVIERQILPLLTRMMAGLSDFIDADMPFLLEERIARVGKLESLIIRSDISSAEKTRRVFEAYQIEMDYGNTIEAWKGKVELKERSLDVDFLRVGRVALSYRSAGSEYGYWDKSKAEWVAIKGSAEKRNIDKGIKVARQEMAPELITLNINNTSEIR